MPKSGKAGPPHEAGGLSLSAQIEAEPNDRFLPSSAATERFVSYMLSPKHGGLMPRHLSDRGPRLEALLDERDHLRIKINLAQDDPINGEELAQMRRQLLTLDREIMKQWGSPNA